MLIQEDYVCIGVIAKHCDNTKLCVAENQSLEFDLPGLYCDFWTTVLDIWNEINAYRIYLAECETDPDCITPPTEPTNYDLKVKLIFGGEYATCNGKTRKQGGVKKVITYYSYARYVMTNVFNDTATGLVQKTNEFSIPIDPKALKDLSNEYRNFGFITFNETINFLCANKDSFTDFDSCECKGCGCGSEKCGGTKAKGFGIRTSNITKKL